MREVYIVDAVRTPVGRMGGTLKNTQAHEMGGLVCKAVSYTHLRAHET